MGWYGISRFTAGTPSLTVARYPRISRYDMAYGTQKDWLQ